MFAAMSQFVVEVVEGPDAGEKRVVDRVLEVGRETGGLSLHDHTASRRHARFFIDESGFRVEDLGSTNGTLLNGEEVHGPTALGPGDVVLVGVSVLEVRTPSQVAAQPTAVRPVPPPLAIPAEVPRYVPDAVDHASRSQPELDRLLDARVRWQARAATIGVAVLAAVVVMVYLALR